jgi:hypothetical protein
MLAGGMGVAAAQEARKQAQTPIVLYVDLSVDPDKEQEMLRNFHTIFKPAAEKFAGYVDVKMLKLHTVIQGTAPPANYRFQLTYRSEELRQKWVASDVHQKVWPTIEKMLNSKNYTVLLFDSV